MTSEPYSDERLLAAARAAACDAYAPYSKISVGAAAMAEDAEVVSGANVENRSSPAGLCAEQVAVGKMIASGARTLRAIAVWSEGPREIFPCGVCLQLISEFGRDIRVIAACPGRVTVKTIAELLPHAASGDDLGWPG